MKTLYALTVIRRDDAEFTKKYGEDVTGSPRSLAFANQGWHHYETRELAEKQLKAVLKNNTKETLDGLWGYNAWTTLEVHPIKCYDHGDAIMNEDMFDNDENGKA